MAKKIPPSLQSPVFEAFCESVERQHIYICDVKTNTWRWSVPAVQYFNLPSDIIEDFPNLWMKRVHPADRESLQAAFSDMFSGKERTHSCEYRVKNHNGDYIWILCRGCMVYDNDGEMNICAGILTHLGQSNKFDFHTGLMSLHEFRRSLKINIEQGKHFGVLLIGIDHFRRINDLNNYAFGNDVLSQFAAKLTEIAPPDTRLYKMDGDKFAYIYENADKKQIENLFARGHAFAKRAYNWRTTCFVYCFGRCYFQPRKL